MRGDVMQMRSSCMGPTGLPTKHFVCLLCEQGAASRSMSRRSCSQQEHLSPYLDGLHDLHEPNLPGEDSQMRTDKASSHGTGRGFCNVKCQIPRQLSHLGGFAAQAMDGRGIPNVGARQGGPEGAHEMSVAATLYARSTCLLLYLNSRGSKPFSSFRNCFVA